MDKLISTESEEFKEPTQEREAMKTSFQSSEREGGKDEVLTLVEMLQQAHKSVIAVREKHRPTIADERYLEGDEVKEFLHISTRTLQTLRDKRLIAFTTIGGKFLYPERELQNVLLDEYRPTELPF